MRGFLFKKNSLTANLLILLWEWSNFHHQWCILHYSCSSLPGSSGPVRTRLLGTRSLSSRTWGSSRWGSGWHGCRQPAERCTRCWNTRGPLLCTHTACSGSSPESTIPPRSKCCLSPRRCFPAAPPPKSQKLRVRKAAVPKRPCALCASWKGSRWPPWLRSSTLSRRKSSLKNQWIATLV